VSQERVEVVRRVIDAWNRRDRDAFMACFDVHAELITDPSWMEAGPFKGRAAIMGWYEGLAEAWEGHDEVVIRDLFEAGERVILRFDWEVRGRTSGLDMKLDTTSVNLVARGRIVRQQYFLNHADALKAVGLER
jgi:ketosteroid isomerase-like protein